MAAEEERCSISSFRTTNAAFKKPISLAAIAQLTAVSLAHQKEFRLLCWTPHWIWQKIGSIKKRREKIASAGFRERGKLEVVLTPAGSSS